MLTTVAFVLAAGTLLAVGLGFLLRSTAGVPAAGLTDTGAGATMLAWAGGALLLGRLRLVRHDATR